MIERGECARLAPEPGARAAIVGAGIGEDLDRDGAIEALIPRGEDLAHAPLANGPVDAVPPDPLRHLGGLP